MRGIIKQSEIKVVGIDLGKSTFHVHGVDTSGQVVLKKQVSRVGLLRLMSNLPCCLVGMEACGGSHDWARRLKVMGHDVRLMGAQFVKPYVKSNKNDFMDAEAICEAVQRPNMRFVPIKGVEQQDVQSIHRAREMAVSHRTAQANQIRGLLQEYGIVLPQGMASLRGRLPEILADADNELTPMFRELLGQLTEEVRRLDERIAGYDRQIKHMAGQSDACQRLMTIPGMGAMSATALVASVADAKAFGNGREMAAWIGLVPRQCSTGGKTRLLGISKRGDSYLRKLLIQGAKSALRFADRKPDRRSRWLCELATKRGRNVAAVALANKNMRTAWALLTKHENYRLAMV
ncbi:MAG: IS110 family transposase [Mariprofundaceae bacterium]